MIGAEQVSSAAACNTRGIPETELWCSRLAKCSRNVAPLQALARQSEGAWSLYKSFREQYYGEKNKNDGAVAAHEDAVNEAQVQVIDTRQQQKDRDRFVGRKYSPNRTLENKYKAEMHLLESQYPWFATNDFSRFAEAHQFESGIKRYYREVRTKLLSDSKKIAQGAACLHTVDPSSECTNIIREMSRSLPPLPDAELTGATRDQRRSTNMQQAFKTLTECTYEQRKHKDTMNGAATDMWVGVGTTVLTCGASSIAGALIVGESATLAAGILEAGILTATEGANIAYEISKCKKPFSHFEIGAGEAANRLAKGPECTVEPSKDWKEFDEDEYHACIMDVVTKAAISAGMIGVSTAIKIPAITESKPVEWINHFLDKTVRTPVFRNMVKTVYSACKDCGPLIKENTAALEKLSAAIKKTYPVSSSEIKLSEAEKRTLLGEMSELSRENKAHLPKGGFTKAYEQKHQASKILSEKIKTLKRAASPELDQAWRDYDKANSQLQAALARPFTTVKDPSAIRTIKMLRGLTKKIGTTERSIESADAAYLQLQALKHLVDVYEETHSEKKE